MGLAWIEEPLWIEVAINSESLLLNIFIGNLFDLCLEIRVLRNGRKGLAMVLRFCSMDAYSGHCK